MTVSDVVGAALIGALILFALVMGTWPLWGDHEKRWAARRGRAGGSGAGMMGVVDELFRPSTHNANLIWEAQQELPAPAPDSDDLWPQLDEGRIRIELPTEVDPQGAEPRSTT